MIKRYLPFALLAAFALAGCTGQKDEAKTDGAASGDKTATAATSDAELMKQAAEVASGKGGEAAKPTDAANAATPVSGAPAGIPGLTLGQDYEIIKDGQPFEPLNGKIEVVEVFNFVCPACNGFQPMLLPWKKTLGADVRFTYVPAAFGGNWDAYVRAFYAAEMMGIESKSHEAIYDAIHLKEQLKGEHGTDSDDDIAKVYAQFGVDPKVFAANMQSFAVNAKFNRAKQYILEQKVGGTPTVMVNGKYRINPRFDDIPRVADALIAYERAHAAGAAAAPAAAKPAAKP